MHQAVNAAANCSALCLFSSPRVVDCHAGQILRLSELAFILDAHLRLDTCLRFDHGSALSQLEPSAKCLKIAICWCHVPTSGVLGENVIRIHGELAHAVYLCVSE